MKIGAWIITIESNLSFWIEQQSGNMWTWPIRLLAHILGFLIFQLTNLFAQLRWPFSAFARFIKSFYPVPPDQPIPVNETKLQKLLVGDQPVLVDFWTEWCGPCIMMEGSLKEFAKQYEGKFVVAKVDATINPKLTKKYNVMGYPTLLLFFDGEELGQITGSLNFTWIVRFVYKCLEEK
jgi:thioredoxin 1